MQNFQTMDKTTFTKQNIARKAAAKRKLYSLSGEYFLAMTLWLRNVVRLTQCYSIMFNR
jgi:hypothetical protein